MVAAIDRIEEFRHGKGHYKVHERHGGPDDKYPRELIAGREEDLLLEDEARSEDFKPAHDGQQRGILDDDGEFVRERRDAQSKRLRQHHVPHCGSMSHPQGLRRLQLPSGHGHESGPEDFGLIRTGMHREGQRGDDDADVLAPEPRWQKGGTEDPGEYHDDDWRNPPEEIDKHREGPREGPERSDSSPADCEADYGA